MRLTKASQKGKFLGRRGKSRMERCIYCGAGTSLHQGETPLCAKCAESSGTQQVPKRAPLHRDHVRRILLLDVAETTARADAASAEFKAIINSIPTGIPQPDGVQRIHQASHRLANARKDAMRAHSRLDNFLNSGAIPEDL